jgi:uncharacterized membrane protein YhaH (DUF805 family)
MMLKAYDSDSDGKDRKNGGVGEIIWYFFSIFLVNFALLIYFYLDYKLIIPKRSLWFPAMIMLTVILSGHIYNYSSWQFKIQLFLRGIVNSLKLLFNKNVEKKRKPEKEKIKGADFFWAWINSYIISFAPLLILISVIEKIEPEDFLKQLIFLMILILAVLFTNSLFAFFRELKERNWWHWLIPLFSVLCLFYIVRDPLIPKMVMRKFHFGNFTAEQLIVEDKGCDILESLYLNPFHIKDQKFCSLNNVNILSRLGTTFYIEAMRQKCKPPWRCTPLHLTIPRQYVMSWNTIKPKT